VLHGVVVEHRNEQFAEIARGLDIGDNVIIHLGSNVEEDASVKKR
jgi:hypothetical protein